jgi:alpha-L-arabinofuranosidase
MKIKLGSVIFLAGLVSVVPPAVGAAVRTATLTVQADGAKPISKDLFGIFFEDLNYAADGGLYAELVQNRSFDYSPSAEQGWDAMSFWTLEKRGDAEGQLISDYADPIHPNNPLYAVIGVKNPGDGIGISNPGFNGIVIEAGETYDFSVFARQLSNPVKPLTVQLETKDGEIIAQQKLPTVDAKWRKYRAELKPSKSDTDARIVLLVNHKGRIGIDMVSLFPRKTFKGRPNGLRADLAQVIADLKPKFMRFPGGCLVHGDGIDNMYRWKETIGPVEQRKGQRNIWRYHQSLGLGYYEYFQFCEDIGAMPIPVVPAGVSCQNSGGSITKEGGQGQQCIPMDDMPAYIQDILDLIEWANGPADSEWGARRAEAGHPEPFNLKYLGVGNEDVISEGFKVRYKMISDAIKAKYPGIVVIGTTGPHPSGHDYNEGWKFAKEHQVEMVDEHGYRPHSWFWQNVQRFDRYERTGTKVYVGEYAARANTLEAALAEAAYMTGFERNGDLVHFSSYAPLLAKQGFTQWRIDLIYFDNVTISPSVNYYVQQLFSINSGDVYLPTEIKENDTAVSTSGNGILLGTWDTQAQFDNLKVRSGGKTVLSAAFDREDKDWKSLHGEWKISGGVYEQTGKGAPTKSMISFDAKRSDYTVTLKAKKTGGSEGFLVGFGALDAETHYWLNLGGWGNRGHQLQVSVDGGQSDFGPRVPGRIETGRWYDIKIEVAGKQMKCYLDGELIIEAADPGLKKMDMAASTVRETETGDMIVKMVSKADDPIKTTIDLSALGTFKGNARCTVLAGDARAENRFGQTPSVLPETKEIKVSEKFVHELPANSLTIIRIPMGNY